MIARFVIVGCLGFVIQLAAVWALTAWGAWPPLWATAVAVEIAIVHNFVWHARGTWKSRFEGFESFDRFDRFGIFLRFNVATAVTSIVGNLLVVALLVRSFHVPVVVANAIAVGAVSVVNFIVFDRWVFKLRCAAIVLVALVPLDAHAAPAAATVRAWAAYVADTEARLERTCGPVADGRPDDTLTANGASVEVPGGTISDWRGSAFVPGVTIDRLLHGLLHPGTPPPQDDVLSSHVIARSEDSLNVAMRLVRHTIVTVTYDTEHEMTFRRRTPVIATARSVATRIEESGGEDHGFLWRLNSYWRYEQRDGGVMVALESLSLSRDIPFVLRPIAGPLAHRVARESMIRTLDALRRQYRSG